MEHCWLGARANLHERGAGHKHPIRKANYHSDPDTGTYGTVAVLPVTSVAIKIYFLRVGPDAAFKFSLLGTRPT